MRILLIEDNPGDARLIREILKEARGNFTISVAEKLELGLKLLLSQDFDVVLLDLNLPDSRGLVTLTELETRFSRLPIVIMTSIDDEELAKQAVRVGAQDYLVKGKINGELLRRTLIYAIERKQVEEALKRNEEHLKRAQERFFQSVLDGIEDIIKIVDENYRILYVNRAVEKLLKKPSESFPGKLCFCEFHGTQQPPYLCPIRKAISSGKSQYSKSSLLNADGTRVFVDHYAFPIFDENGKVKRVIEVIKDVTEKQKLEEALREKEKLAAIGELAAGIAHEIKNPLAVIVSSAQIIANQSRPEEQKKEATGLILSEARKLDRIIKGFLTFARPNRPNFRLINVKEILEQTLSLWGLVKKEDKEMVIIRNFSKDLPLIQADPEQIQQVFMNLLHNAYEAISENGELLIEVKEKGEGEIEILFQDTGCGIFPEDLANIFNPFFTTKSEGTGLGLAIVRQILNSHGASIEVFSQAGKGSQFRITIWLK